VLAENMRCPVKRRTVPGEELDHVPRRLVEAALAVAPRHPACETPAEELIAAARLAATRHG